MYSKRSRCKIDWIILCVREIILSNLEEFYLSSKHTFSRVSVLSPFFSVPPSCNPSSQSRSRSLHLLLFQVAKALSEQARRHARERNAVVQQLRSKAGRLEDTMRFSPKVTIEFSICPKHDYGGLMQASYVVSPYIFLTHFFCLSLFFFCVLALLFLILPYYMSLLLNCFFLTSLARSLI